MRKLTIKEIEKLAARKGAKRIAVENFLFSMGTDERAANYNLSLDAGLYGWNLKTTAAIRAGIKLACC